MDKDSIFVTECWCKICNAYEESLVYHSNLKGSIPEGVKRFIKGTNNVVKSALERYLCGKGHNTGMQHEPSTSEGKVKLGLGQMLT